MEVDSDGEVKLTAKDWAIVQLATPCFVTELLIDTNHFKGNFPESCTIQGCNVPDAPHDDFIDGTSNRVCCFELVVSPDMADTACV